MVSGASMSQDLPLPALRADIRRAAILDRAGDARTGSGNYGPEKVHHLRTSRRKEVQKFCVQVARANTDARSFLFPLFQL